MSQIIGVGFLLFSNGNGTREPRLYTIKELGDKPQYHKKAGMLSFPLETFRPEDGNCHGTIQRLFEEEMGVSQELVCIEEVVEKEFRLIPGRDDISTFYGVGRLIGPQGNFQPKDEDIEFVGWRTVEDLLTSFIRVEVAPILRHLLSSALYEKLLGEY